jgi:hypothetical protein
VLTLDANPNARAIFPAPRSFILPFMRRLITIALLLLAVPALYGQQRDATFPRQSPSASVSQTFGVTTVNVTYGRPAVRGRNVFSGDGAIVPPGQVWRTGADEASTITFSTDVRVAGQALAAGTYGLFTIPSGPTWTVIFNSVPAQWGAFSYDAVRDVLRIEVSAGPSPSFAERFTIGFEDVDDHATTLYLAWANTRVPVAVSADTDALLRRQGDAAVAAATEWRVPFRYAAYALANERVMDAGRAWSDRAVALQSNYSTLRQSALYAAAAGETARARAIGEAALQAGRAQPTPPQDLAEFARRVEGWR